MWGLKGTYGSQAVTAWDTVTDCSGVYVGVIDSAIQTDHPDLEANMWVNTDERMGDGIDNDGNGLVDDVHGYDFFNKKGTLDSPTLEDQDFHGTHVAGTIGASGNNSFAVAGMCWKTQLISAKIFGLDEKNKSSTTSMMIISAIDYITNLKRTKKLNIVATSNSYGGSGFSRLMLAAINRGYEAGILFIAAAGNGWYTMPIYPAAYSQYTPAVISVAALEPDGSLAEYSSRGPWVHLAAPGSDIWSTLPDSTYGTMSGTSMAAPHVTGAAALYKARWPTATAEEIKAAIISSVTPTASLLNGKTITGGRLNAAAMLTVVPRSSWASSSPPPSPPPRRPPPPRPPPPTPVPRPSPPLSSAAFFVNCSYRAASGLFGVGQYEARPPTTFPNDQLSSLQVPAGLTVVLYEHFRLAGRNLVFVGPTNVQCMFTHYQEFNDVVSSWTVSRTPSPVSFCFRYANAPTRSLVYRSADCSPRLSWGWTDPNVGAGGQLKAFASAQPGTVKHCYRYAGNPARMLFYRSDDCTARWGWGWTDPNFGAGGEVWLYASQQPGTVKYCYRYANNPERTLFYRSDDCTARWGWGWTHRSVGAGGEVWAPV